MTSPATVDPRGLRFAAAITTVVLAAVLLLPPPAREILLTIQLVVFALGTFVGLSASPYGLLYKILVRPRLGPPAELEDSAPPRFAQGVGLAFAAVALVAFVAGAPLVGLIATAAAFVAALLNAAIGFCLGCELYLTTRKLAKTFA